MKGDKNSKPPSRKSSVIIPRPASRRGSQLEVPSRRESYIEPRSRRGSYIEPRSRRGSVIEPTGLQKRAQNLEEARELKKKRERRSKEVKLQRNYVCGCGKSYLSYAALYTHAKTKHDGVFPEGTATLHKKKQGRPKRDEWSNLRISSEYQRTYDFNKDFQQFLDKIPGARDQRDKANKNLIEYFPCELFVNQVSYEKLLIKLEQIRKELIEFYGPNFLHQIDIIIFEINNGKKLTCDEVMALFLIYAFRFITKPFYRELVFIMVSYREMLNEGGWARVRELGELGDSDPTKEFCTEITAEYVPDFANKFMLEYFLDCMYGNKLLIDPSKLQFFSLDPLKLLWTILLIKFLCQWLFIHRFTKAKIDVQKD